MNENQSENNYRYPENAYRDQKGAPYSYEPIPRSPAPLYKKQPEPTRRKTRGWVGLMATALCFSLLGSALGAGGVMYYISREESAQEEPLQQEVLPAEEQPTEDAEDPVTIMVEGVRENAAIELVQVDTGKLLTAAEVYAANVNSTVGITTSATTNYFGFQTTSAAAGSGFIISTDGYVLTNHHVIEDADEVTVAMYDGTTYDAQIVGYDKSNDIAVLKVETGGTDLPPIIWGDSDSLNIGDSVVAIGNPLGELTFSLTAGTISAKDREVTLSSSVTLDLLQTDCAINTGNSGGALFNMYGEVIGITNAKYSSSSSEATIDNIGFAIPVNAIRPIVESIIEKGYLSSPYIGVSVSDVSQESQLYGIPAGIAIQSVTENSPAAEAGLSAGDVITAVDGAAMNYEEMVEYIGNCTPGDVLLLEIYRQGETMSVSVVVGEQTQPALEEEEPVTTEPVIPGQFPQNGMNGGNPFGGFGGIR